MQQRGGNGAEEAREAAAAPAGSFWVESRRWSRDIYTGRAGKMLLGLRRTSSQTSLVETGIALVLGDSIFMAASFMVAKHKKQRKGHNRQNF